MQSQIRAPGLGHSVNHVNRPVSAPTFGPRTCPSSCHRHQHKARGISLIVRAEDYYNVLGVEKNADKKTIKQAYRQKARKYHPDVNKEAGAEDTFKRIGEAYEVLSDDNKRAVYDRYGEAGLKGGMGGMGGMGADGFSNPMDIFEQFFGGGFSSMGGMGGMGGGARSRTRAQQGEDERVELQLDFLEAVFGAQKEITVERLVTDPTCGGTGMKAGTSPQTCPQCGGRGTVMSTMRTPLGVFQSVQECPRCNATGQIITPCEKCGGDGRISESKKISIKVPAGVDNGSRLRVRGEGNAGRRGGESGDMYVYITVKEHPEMRREGNDIHSDIEVSYVDAILGTQHKVTTVDGPVELRIPPGTQPGTTLLMNKRGVPRLGNTVQRGDHHVHVRVKIPKQLSTEERKLVEELKELQSKAKVGPFRF